MEQDKEFYRKVYRRYGGRVRLDIYFSFNIRYFFRNLFQAYGGKYCGM